MSETGFNLYDPLQPATPVQTSVGEKAFNPETGMMLVKDKGLMEEIKGERPWVSVREFENPALRPPQARSRSVFLMPEMPWKKQTEEQNGTVATIST